MKQRKLEKERKTKRDGKPIKSYQPISLTTKGRLQNQPSSSWSLVSSGLPSFSIATTSLSLPLFSNHLNP
ncbi:Protein CBG25997 [Caenorhabditis briggsae]|uniref:Protein CBG25997 n=1 Tax=Caenorhabditis briggsae TaxID=6238 RepID=B6IKU7_CAEBR|nr:Protein CBG25997 [Caenorhabditis briggsae]CAS00527.1 Protein CBG25997 [Caenorhabditis briggsae]